MIGEPGERTENRLAELLATLTPVAEKLPDFDDPPIEPENVF